MGYVCPTQEAKGSQSICSGYVDDWLAQTDRVLNESTRVAPCLCTARSPSAAMDPDWQKAKGVSCGYMMTRTVRLLLTQDRKIITLFGSFRSMDLQVEAL